VEPRPRRQPRGKAPGLEERNRGELIDFAQLFHGAFFSGQGFFFLFNGGLFIMFPLADFGEDAGFFRRFFEAFESAFDGFAVFDTNGCQLTSPPSVGPGRCFLPKLCGKSKKREGVS